jgi:hypothetical protein
MPLQPGSRIGPYDVLELAGVGGMGEVYKARDVRLGRVVALKTLSSTSEQDPAARSRLTREARAVAALNHPHICGIHDVVEWEGQLVLVMEFLHGETLRQRLDRGLLPVDEVFAIGIQIASALLAAHREGIIHRDLKPSNVVLTRSGVKLLDFGIAQQRSTASPWMSDVTISAPPTSEGHFAGTVPYMAPEQLEGRPVDARADIFAFGALLFETATGERAFSATSPAALAAAILSEQRPRLAERAPGVPRALDRIVSVCLARDPDHRWQHSADLLLELRWAQQDLEGYSESAASQPVRRRGWTPHVLWAAALIAVVLSSFLWVSRGGVAEPPPNPIPVIVLMDSPLPGRVYDPRTAAAGGTNADDVTDALRDLPVALRKENTSAIWHREEQVIAERPDLIVSHLSCLYDSRVAGEMQEIADHLFDQAADRLMLFFAYAAARNPRTHFIVYSRTVFHESGGEQQWVHAQEARLPILKGRLQAFIVPGGLSGATFRDPETAKLLRTRITQLLELP